MKFISHPAHHFPLGSFLLSSPATQIDSTELNKLSRETMLPVALPSLRRPRALPSFLLLLLLIFFFFLTVSPSNAATEIVQKVCNQTSYYRYCVAALYSDPRTPNADSYFLAYISFSVAYVNASNTHGYFSHVVNSTRPSHHKLVKSLTTCRDGYRGAVSALETAYEDLNTESFAGLGRLSRVAGRAAAECGRALSVAVAPGSVPPTIAVRNWDMKRLSEICGVVSKLFGSSK